MPDAPSPITAAREFSYALYQDGLKVAQVWSAKEEEARREIEHYAFVYGQDGPVEIRKVRVRGGRTK